MIVIKDKNEMPGQFVLGGDPYYKTVFRNNGQIDSSCYQDILNVGMQQAKTTFDKKNYLKKISVPKALGKNAASSGIVNLVFENFQRQHKKEPLIPLFVLIDGDDQVVQRIKSLPNYDYQEQPKQGRPIQHGQPQDILEAQRKRSENKMIRRGYALVTHDNPNIRSIANQTIQFFKVGQPVSSVEGKYSSLNPLPPCSLTNVSPPWEHKQWEDLWKKKGEKQNKPLWKQELDQLIQGTQKT